MRGSSLVGMILFVLPALPVTSQTPVADSLEAGRQALRHDAESMGKLFVQKDLEAYTKYVYPGVVKLSGGPSKLAELIHKTLAKMEEGGLSFSDVKIGEPGQMVRVKKQWQALIPQVLFMKMNNGILEQTSWLIGVSDNNGKSWTFIDSGGKTHEQIKAVLPTLTNQLEIPIKGKPVFHPNTQN